MHSLKVLSLEAFCACLYGFVFLSSVVSDSEDCSSSSDAQEQLFVNIGDDVKFRVEADVGDPFDYYIDHFEFYYGRDRVCLIDILFGHGKIRDLSYMYFLPVFENRTTIVGAYGDWHHITFNIIIDNAELTDNGTYKVHAIRTDYSKCFLVYILGPPASEIIVTPAVVEVGNAALLNCSSKTTIVPETHNLTISISWYLDGQAIKPCGRFSVDSNGLYIYVVTEADIDLVITCEAKEERGLTTRINTTLPIYWGPDPVPKLQPTHTFYQVKQGMQLLHIYCSVDCHPPCDVRWYELGGPAVLSLNGTLSLGELGRNSTGEYMCTATNFRTTEESSVSIYILIKEDQEHTITPASSVFKQNYTPVGAVGGALGTALLLALICIMFLLRRGNTSKSCNLVSFSSRRDDQVEMSVQSPRYEDVQDNERTSQQYEDLNTDVVKAVINEGGTNKTTKDLSKTQKDGKSEMMVYENTCIDQRD